MGSAILGIIVAVVIGFYARGTSALGSDIYVDKLGILVVVGGTFAAAAISYSLPDLARLFLSIFKVFTLRRENAATAVAQIISIAQKSQNTPGVETLSQDQKIHPFIRDGLRLVESPLRTEQIPEIMNIAIKSRRQVMLAEIEVLKSLSKYPPAFGMIGTVLGLSALMYGLGSEETKSRIGPNMSVALTTTLYGLLISNAIFQPMVDNLTGRLNQELRVRAVIMHGILLVNNGEDPVLIQEMLNAHLLPSQRREFVMGSASAKQAKRAA